MEYEYILAEETVFHFCCNTENKPCLNRIISTTEATTSRGANKSTAVDFFFRKTKMK